MDIVTKEKCLNEYRKGKSVREICDMFNMKYYQVYNSIKEIKRDGFIWKQLIPEVDKIIDLYRNGNSTVVIGKMYGVSNKPIARLLEHYNIPRTGVGRRKYHVNESYFDKINTPNKAYILGFLFADGSNNRDKCTISMSLEERDREILERIRIEMENEHCLEYLDYSNKHDFGYNYKNQYRMLIFSSHMCDTLIDKGMIPNKSLKLSFPKYLDENLVSHFIRGYFDGDGSMGVGDVSKLSSSLHISITSTREFCIALNHILQQHEIEGKVSDASCKNGVTSVLSIHKKADIKKFLDWIYKDADLCLKRKYDIYKVYYNYNGK